jgi:cell fate regulator YaaT (PSP1 superfamily)
MIKIIEIIGDGTFKWQCSSTPELGLHQGDICVISVDDILEYGEVMKVAGEKENADPSIKGKVLRRATLQDRSVAQENQLKAKSALHVCEEKIKTLKLNMNIIKVHYSFDRNLLTINYEAEDRVDFRQLVYDLSSELKTRIYMHHMGPREVATLCGGFAPCGRELCCKVWLKELDNVHIRMAKQQRLSLNPSVINGMCGRLKCCLKYEEDYYRDISLKMPQPGSIVRTPQGEGKVVDFKLLSQKVRVELTRTQNLVEFGLQDIAVISKVRQPVFEEE